MKMAKWMVLLLLVAVMGCKNGENQMKQLQAKNWQLKVMKYEGKTMQVPEKSPDLFFTDSAACYGFAGCNRFFGKYDADGEGNISIQLGGTTMMFCPDIEFEDAYLKAFPKVKRYTISDQKLILKDLKETVYLEYILRKENE